MTHIRLHLLGDFRCLAEDGTQVDIAMAKDQGLLAILALSPGFKSPRSRITDLLWSTRGSEQARASLRQSLWSLKKSIGNGTDSVLQVDRRRIALNPHLVETDVGNFHKLTASASKESLEDAVALYQGDLVQGLEIRDEAWEEWLTMERQSLRQQAVGALRRLIDHYGAESRAQQLIDAGRKLVELEPFHEEGHRAMMRGYAESNQRTLALKQYERCRELLQRELDINPDAATQDLFSQVKAGDIAVRQDARESTLDSRFASDLPAKPSTEMAAVLEELPRTATHTTKPSILIMPFVNVSDDRTQDYVARGVTDNIIIALTRFRELFVFAYKTSMATESVVESPTDAYKQLGARYAVEGSVQRTKDRIRVTARLVDAQSGQHLWAQNYDRDLDDLLAVQDEITELIVNSLVGTVEEAHHQRARDKPLENLLAYDFVLRGRVLLNRYTRDGELEARRNFHKAIDLDPVYAAAHAGLAVSYIHEYEAPWCKQPEHALSVAFERARKAVALDGLNIMGRYALASAYYYGREYELANLEIENAITINPHDYHVVCAKAWFMTYSGHLQEGLACGIDAMRTNPYSADGCLETIGLGQYLSGHYEQALMAFGSTKADSLFKLGGLAACYAQLGRTQEAARAAKDFVVAADQSAPADDDSSNSHWRSYWNRMYRLKDLGDREHLLDGLRKAGIPVD